MSVYNILCVLPLKTPARLPHQDDVYDEMINEKLFSSNIIFWAMSEMVVARFIRTTLSLFQSLLSSAEEPL